LRNVQPHAPNNYEFPFKKNYWLIFCFQLFLILSLNLQFHYGNWEFIFGNLMMLFLVKFVHNLNLPFGEDKVDALHAAAHMRYAKQIVYKELNLSTTSATPYVPKNHHHCDPTKVLRNPW